MKQSTDSKSSSSSAPNTKRRQCHLVISSIDDQDEKNPITSARSTNSNNEERFFDVDTDGKSIRVGRPRSTVTKSYGGADSVALLSRVGDDGDDIDTLTELRESVMSGVASALWDGIDLLLWTFGPMGTGKTTTLFGDDGVGGLMSEVCEALVEGCFGTSSSPSPPDDDDDERVILSVSRLAFTADATDRVFDMLSDEGDRETSTRALRVREDADGGRFYVENCHDVVVRDGFELNLVLRLAHAEATRRASRDPTTLGRHHTLVTFTVTRRFGNGDSITSSVRVLDLCGAARGGGVGGGAAKGGRRAVSTGSNKEDRTLRAVHRVIDSLSSKKAHVPYRDSKVTRLTGRCLGGGVDGATGIAVVFVPTGAYDEMCSTLDFADRVGSIAPPVVASSSATDGGRRGGMRINQRVLLEQAEAKVSALAARNGMDDVGALVSSGIELDMDSPLDLVELRDALAAVVSLRVDPVDTLVKSSDAWWRENADRVERVRATVDDSSDGR